MRIKGLTTDKEGCLYYRLLLPLAAIQEKGGHVCELGPDIGDDWPWDVLVGQRVNTAEVWNSLRSYGIGKRLVFETDDDLWSIDRTNPAFYEVTPEFQKGMIGAIKASDVVTVSTDPLADVVRKWNPNVAVLPNCVDEKLLRLPRIHNDKVTVGWSGGTSHYKDLKGPAIEAINDMEGAELHIIGSDFREAFRVPIRWTPFVPVLDLYRRVDFDIGIAPLAKTKFNRSKSHVRALEYAARGIPTIATNWDPYKDFIVHGETGFLADSYSDWRKYLKLLITDTKRREEMGAAAKEVARQYTIQGRWHEWEEVYAG